MKSLRIIFLGLILLLSISIGMQSAFAVGTNNYADRKQVNNELTQEQVTDLTDQFMDILVQDVDRNYKVIHYETKEALLTAFEMVTIKEVAMDYIDFYYNESDDGLYILPTETPPWLVKENKYTIEQLAGNKVRVVQTNQSYLHGLYTIEFEFTFDDKWKITKIAAHN